MRKFIPPWATRFAIGAVVIGVSLVLVIGLVSNATKVPVQFFDDLGRTIHRVLPQEQPDIATEPELKVVIRAIPDGRLRVGSVIEDDDVVVFTVTAKRAAVRAAVAPGDELRISRDGEVEIAPQGIPGILDQLGEELRKLKERFFGP